LRFDPVQIEVWRHLLAAVAEEMGATLQRTAYSPNIKERLDYSCAIFDAAGLLLAQAAHIPVHLGAMPLMMESLRHRVPWRRGSMWLCNDPRYGGTHLPDITLVAPVTLPGAVRGSIVGFVASRAHHADIGGMTPGSLPLSTEAFQEGLILPPVELISRGKVRSDVLELLCANSRTPAERRGDIAAQIAANETGIRRLSALVTAHGRAAYARRAHDTVAYAEAAVRTALRELPPGTYLASDELESDGVGAERIPLVLAATVSPVGQITFDFTGSAPQVAGSVNATEAITRSACGYMVRCLVDEEIPTNAGCFAPIRVIAPEGTIVNARFPAAVAGGNVETSQRIVDLLLSALAVAAPDRIPAASQGTMNNVTIGGYDPVRKRPFAYYETLGGGAGAGAHHAGASSLHTHMTNTRNTPVEALESHYPLQVLEYSLATGTGGAGANSGGDGLRRCIRLLGPARITLLTERRIAGPPGLAGGGAGTPGYNELTLPDGTAQSLPSKWSGACEADAILAIRTPGGGGWGAPKVPMTTDFDSELDRPSEREVS
jgi:N-methylhydantoinase B